MFTKSRLIVVCALAALGATVLVVGAIGASGSDIADHVNWKTSGRVDTPSSTFLNTNTAVTVTPPTPSPLAIRFSATGYEQDFNSGGSFAGNRYAAMLVRVTVDGLPVGPVVRLFDNTGKIGVQKPRPTVSSYEWIANVSAGSHTVRVQFKNLNAFDNATILKSTLSVLHND
jgi:hypothetical protein